MAAPGGLHPRAAATFLEGLSLWYQQTLSVVLCVDDGAAFYAMGLCDSLGFGPRQLHYDLDITSRVRARPRRTIAGLGDFRDLRQMSLAAEWSR